MFSLIFEAYTLIVDSRAHWPMLHHAYWRKRIQTRLTDHQFRFRKGRTQSLLSSTYVRQLRCESIDDVALHLTPRTISYVIIFPSSILE